MANKWGKGQLRDVADVGSVINAGGHEGSTVQRKAEVRALSKIDNLTAADINSGEINEPPMNNPGFGQKKAKSISLASEGEKNT